MTRVELDDLASAIRRVLSLSHALQAARVRISFFREFLDLDIPVQRDVTLTPRVSDGKARNTAAEESSPVKAERGDDPSSPSKMPKIRPVPSAAQVNAMSGLQQRSVTTDAHDDEAGEVAEVPELSELQRLIGGAFIEYEVTLPPEPYAAKSFVED